MFSQNVTVQIWFLCKNEAHNTESDLAPLQTSFQTPISICRHSEIIYSVYIPSLYMSI